RALRSGADGLHHSRGKRSVVSRRGKAGVCGGAPDIAQRRDDCGAVSIANDGWRAVTYPVAFWPGALGLLLLIAGLITHWTEYRRSARHPFDLTAFGPVFVGASLAAFAGEHFASAANLAQLVPRFLPGRLFIAYFV